MESRRKVGCMLYASLTRRDKIKWDEIRWVGFGFGLGWAIYRDDVQNGNADASIKSPRKWLCVAQQQFALKILFWGTKKKNF